jgi:hypothetical protein
LNAFTLRAWDGALASASPAVQVVVNTAAVDDSPRVSGLQTLSVRENLPFSTAFSALNVDDNQPTSWSLEGSDASFFEINSTGQVSLRQSADFERKTSYNLTVRATDAGGEGLSATSELHLTVLDQPDQSLAFTPTSLAFIPTIDKTVTLNGFYSQDQPLTGSSLPQSFSSLLTYDGASLDLDPLSLNQSGLSIVNSDRGTQGPSTLAISSTAPANISSFKLDFNVAQGAIGPFAFSWTLDGSAAYEKQINSPVMVSPDADAFIVNGALDLSAFRTPLRIATADKQVRLLNQGSVTLPYQKPIASLMATASADELVLNQSLSFNLGSGDDVVDLRPLASQVSPVVVTGLLGSGRDTVKLTSLSASARTGSTINIGDFQLGFDSIQLSTGQSLVRRQDVLGLLGQADGALAQSAAQLRFAAVADDLDPGTKTLISSQGAIVPLSIALDPGSDGRRLQVSLSSGVSPLHASARLALREGALPTGYAWSIAPDGASAALTLPASASLANSLGDLRAAVGLLSAQSAQQIDGQLQVRWLDAGGNTLTSTSTAVQILPHQPVAGTAPIRLELLAGTPASQAVQFTASTGADSITLLSDALDRRVDKVFGGLGDDVLVTGDGDRLIGGLGSDVLIAKLGLGTTQLSSGAGSDLLIAGQNDALTAGDGSDVLVARGLGNRLSGGLGSDIFVLADERFGAFTGVMTPNRILDFKAEDKIAFNIAGLQRSDFSIVDTAAGSVVRLSEPFAQRFGTTDLAILQGVRSGALNTSQILINAAEARLPDSILSRVDVLDQGA